jgi:hypothetical protein
MVTHRSWLLKDLREVLVPELESLGFQRLALSREDAAAADIRRAFPFGRYRRSAPGGFEQIEVQLDRRGRAAFRLNVGWVPDTGIQHAVAGEIQAEEVWVHYLAHGIALPSLTGWYSCSRWFWRRVTTDTVRDLVEKAVRELEPKLKSYFVTGSRL